MASVQQAPAEVVYPESDGKPMAETPTHRDNMIAMIDVLRTRFAADPMLYVSGNMFLYYERGNPRRCVAPDVFVARVRADAVRRVYKTWEEGRGPELVIEVTSPGTRDEDFEDKFALYRDVLQVPEYFLFDPLHEYLDPPLQGFRLVNGQYQPIEPVAGRLPSAVLGLHFEAEGELLRLYDPAAGARLLTSPEGRARAEQAWAESERARKAEERKRKRAEQARIQAEQARIQAEQARIQAEQAQIQAEQGHAQEHAARLAVEEELARVRRELEELRARPGNLPS